MNELVGGGSFLSVESPVREYLILLMESDGNLRK